MIPIDENSDRVYIGENEPTTRGLGDGVLLTGVIREINLKYPDKKIIVKTQSPKEVFMNNPRIAEVHDGWWEDLELWPKGRWRAPIHQVKNLCETYGIYTENINAEIFLTEHEALVAKKTLELVSPDKPAIMFCRNSTDPNRDWTDEAWFKIIEMLNKKYNVFQIDESIRYDHRTGGMPRVMSTISNARQELRGLPIRNIFGLMYHSRKYLGTNTGWMACATAFGNDNFCYMYDPKMWGAFHWVFPRNNNIFLEDPFEQTMARIKEAWMDK